MSYTMEESDWKALRALNRAGKLAERNQRIVELVLDQGLRRSEVAWGLRMSAAQIGVILAASGRWTPKTREEVAAEAKRRRTEALAKRESGMTLQAIGDSMGVSRERARQLVMIARRRIEAA